MQDNDRILSNTPSCKVSIWLWSIHLSIILR